MYGKAEGFHTRKNHGSRREFFINGQQVSEAVYMRRYAHALENELDELHIKLAKIYELL
ncbi:hypothetical protein [Bifidobacterium canis]|uniref:Uncharacterized protein n=1 Tax=Bifidobacterium canis TaxID=2610880 RepID=A0A7K1J4H1_9BIFI|nr:hypothetical protein [Bifidobacterium canis]MUH59439.1 hypothetical protein [Bifidobacterium canis]